ncbi:MAG: T9SS type A sorting domain-containing protein [Ignavibacteria bacterium]|jgi:hypothetical protein|nr:T9SS type A sorting domain-containing protein [Ignavibacteria bacterium]
MKGSTFYFILLLLLSYSLSATITIQYSDYIAGSGSKGEPLMGCNVLATKDGTPIYLTNTNAQLIESDVLVNRTLSIGAPSANGTQHITFSPAIATPHLASFELVVTNGTEVETRQFPPLYDWKGYDLRLYKVEDHVTIVNELNFNTEGPSEQVAQFYFSVRGNYTTDPTYIWTQAPFIDSITFTNPNFRYVWTGLPPDKTGEPPKKVILECSYLITVTYNAPPGNPFLKEFMIFHFGGGTKYKLPITTNTYNLNALPSLQLLSPNGGEKLAPCEKFTIRWEGQAKGHTVYIQYSTDDQTTWKDIAKVNGDSSSYIWTVPNTISDNCYVRIYQQYDQSLNQFVSIKEDTSKILSAIFNYDGTRGITTSYDNNVIEWNLYPTPTTITNVNVNNYANNLYTPEITSAAYIIDNEYFVALDAANHNLLFFNSGENTVSKYLTLPTDVYSDKVLTDKKQRYICVTPATYGNTMIFVDTAGRNPVIWTENMPITNAFISDGEDVIYVTLLDNTIKMLDMSAYPIVTTRNTYDFAKEYNMIEAMSVSQDLRLLGLSIRQNKPSEEATPFLADNLIYDRYSNVFFKDLKIRSSYAVSLDFNPTGRLAILGHPDNPQVCIMDLTDDSQFKQTLINYLVPELYGLTVAKTGNAMLVRSHGDSNCVLVNFSLPENDVSDSPFSIIRPVVALASSIELTPQLIGTTKGYTFTAQLCNRGEAVAIFEKAYFKNGVHFNFDNVLNNMPLTIYPGECKDFTITVTPLDTGDISDELCFVACNVEYNFPFSIHSINRNLSLSVSNPLDFGEQCLYVERSQRIELFRNRDTIPVTINDIVFRKGQHFKVIYQPKDTVLQPGDTYVATLAVNPLVAGNITDTLVVYHSNQSYVRLYIPVIGRGIGTELSVSHTVLPFIPEIKQRTITLTNTGDANLYIDSIVITPAGLYKCNTPLPIYVNPLEQQQIEIEYIGDTIAEAKLNILAKPCAMSEEITLTPYYGNANLTIPTVEAKPTDMDAVIPITMTKTENYPYKGERFFETEITINQHIFYPLAAVSDFGTATIIRNEVVDTLRYIKVRVVGDFTSNTATLVEIHGLAALYETDKSDIEFIDNSIFFGDSVYVNYKNGLFQLLNLAPDRYITYKPNLTINSVSPNPINTTTTISYTISDDILGYVTLEVIDITGSSVLQPLQLDGNTGEHSKSIDITGLPAGEYKVVVHYENDVVAYKIIKK